MTLRRIHAYLGCLFAPLLLFFAVSGMWQTLGWNWRNPITGEQAQWLAVISTVHTNDNLKTGGSLSNLVLQCMAVAMSLALIAMVIMGVVMALKVSRRPQIVYSWILLGALLPLLSVLLPVLIDSGL